MRGDGDANQSSEDRKRKGIGMLMGFRGVLGICWVLFLFSFFLFIFFYFILFLV